MKAISTLIFIFCVGINFSLLANGDDPEQPVSGKAFRVMERPKIDGIGNEAIWTEKNLFYKGYFTQNQPNNGEKSEQLTEVYITYDDFAIYIYAKMYDHSDSILHEFSPRDIWDRNTDAISFSFDTYNKQQNAFGFLVTAAGVQTDTYFTPTNNDDNWNAVWRSAVHYDKDFWAVEYEIPYSALRFPKKDVQTWGINIMRVIRRKRERSFWNPVDVSVQGYVNQFGTLTGLKNIKSPIRLSFTPYLSGYLIRDEDNITTPSMNGGMDVKLGLNEGFTLDMSLIPDFGQVRSDNVVLNLSPFEVQFDENRPFFNEGTELFNKVSHMFYSRRVGGIFGEADLGDDEEVEVQDNVAQLLNATKVSGRNRDGLGIGFFNAFSNETYATIKNTETDERRTVRLDPRTNFNVLVIDQNLKNNSGVTFVNTNVTRIGGDNANVTGVDFVFNDKKNTWSFTGFGAVSQLMERQSEGEYKNDVGFKYKWGFGKQSGIHQFRVGQNVESHNYDTNDLGFLRSPNEVTTFAQYQYNIFQPKRNILRLRYTVQTDYEMLQKPLTYASFRFRTTLWVRYKNFWNTFWRFNISPVNFDYFAPREDGWYFRRMPSFASVYWFETDERKAFRVGCEVGMWTRPSMQQFDNWVWVNLRYRVNDKLSFEHMANTVWVRKERDYVTTKYFDEEETELDKIIYGKRNRFELTNLFTGLYNFNELMNLSLRIRHYWSNVKYSQYFDLQKDGRLSPNDFEEFDEDTNEPAYNRNFNAFNIDLVYTWQFAPGSQMSLVWKNSIYKDETFTNFTYYDNLTRTLRAPQTNSLSIRLLYFLDYLDFKKYMGRRKK